MVYGSDYDTEDGTGTRRDENNSLLSSYAFYAPTDLQFYSKKKRHNSD